MSDETKQAEPSFLSQLFEHGLLIRSAVPGVYGRSGVFEDVVNRLEELITLLGHADSPEVMRFPPVMSRENTIQSGYMNSFPQLLGSVHSFMGTHRQHAALLQAISAQEDWGPQLSSTQVVLTPAACYPVYAAMADTQLPPNGRLVDVCSYCFRHEPSDDPARMQAFRQREYVRVAAPEIVQSWREVWMERATLFLRSLGLHPEVVPANDPFFGPGGRFLAASQQEQDLKFELLATINSEQAKTALVSVNYHQDHFTEEFHIHNADGTQAHTACIGFGLERITLALFRAHGLDVQSWPAAVREKLWTR